MYRGILPFMENLIFVKPVCVSNHDGRWVGVCQGWGSIKASLHSDSVCVQHRGAAPERFRPGPRGRFQGGSVDVSVMGSQYGMSQQRLIPYGHSSRREEGWMDMIGGGNAHRFVAEDSERGGKIWFKITVRYDKKSHLTSQNLCPIAFIPLHYSTEGHKVYFCLEDAAAASALCKLTRRVTERKGNRVVVFMNCCSSPPFLQSELKPQDLKPLLVQKSLDLNSICTDPDLVSCNTEMMLNRKNCMQAMIKVIQENIPEVRLKSLTSKIPVCFTHKTLLVFTVSGVFKEGESCLDTLIGACLLLFVAFCSLCIVNDELFVRNTTSEEIRCAFAAPAAAPSISSVLPTLTASQQEVLSTFSQNSEMNLEWSQK
uniref:Nuclear RNA export factor 1a n=1 Tax=Cyprinus carpio carpio TaxID=630221 RepID=A0A9J8ACX9_CYPCA